MTLESAIHRKAIDLARLCIESTTAAGSGHPSTGLSLAHIITVLMYCQMRWDPKDPWNRASDRLVLSEGHAVPFVYAAYADLGAMLGQSPADARPMTRQDALDLRAIHSPIDGHPHPRVGFPFADAATGSLGQGLSVAAGLALAARMDDLDRNFYCIIGDGESREGQIWEAADFLVDQRLTNVVSIFNCNDLAQSDWVSPQQSAEVLTRKLEAFGFFVTVIDGHDPRQILGAFQKLNVVKNGSKPLAIVARTIKGWGAPDEQGMGKHGAAVKKEHMQRVLAQLERTAAALGVADLHVTDELSIPPVAAKAKPIDPSPIKAAPFLQGLAMVGLDREYSAGKPIATRKAYSAAIVALGRASPRIVVLDADMKNSTFTEWFAQRLPQQFIECRIAEQNMISTAVGLAAAGRIPFCSSYGKFLVRAYDQIEMAMISGANFKIAASHAGVTLAADGPSQMAVADVPFFRAFAHVKSYNGRPAATCFFPADAVSTYAIAELMANLDGFCYLRLLRSDVGVLYRPGESFEAGGFKVLREGRDLTFVSAGYMVHECLRAADELARGRQACNGHRRLLAAHRPRRSNRRHRPARAAAGSSPSRTTTPAGLMRRSRPPSPQRGRP
jgi:transketolase